MIGLLSFLLLAAGAGVPARYVPVDVPTDRVHVEVCDQGLPETNAWPVAAVPAAVETFDAPAFAFSRLPHRYRDTGVRVDRPNPHLLRAVARVRLPAGNHRLLLRGRGACRLFVDGRLVLATPFPPNRGDGSDGRDPSTEPYLDLGPDFRFAPPGNREAWTRFATRGGEHRVVLETIVGGRIGKTAVRRPEVGETVVAVSLDGQPSFALLGPGATVPYTDAGWTSYAAAETERIARLEADRRAAAFHRHRAFWDARRAEARRWLAATPEVPIPPLPSGFPAHNPIDHFLAVRLAAAAPGGTAGKVSYARDVRPILEAKCFSCHQGAKARGDLRLDGPSDAVVPGRPDESTLLARVTTDDDHERMPPKGGRLSADEVRVLRDWVREGGRYAEPPGRRTDLAADLPFLRRVTLDTVGLVPRPDEVAAFLADRSADRRTRVIDRLLADPRRADHWVGYWQDVLAENPNILNPTLNNTGPFRWWLHEAFLDHKPFDVLVTELVRMGGSERDGGPAGFAVASENDVPMAEKGVIVASAFLGVNLRCARCHDAPTHRATQRDLFRLAGLLAGGPLTVPKTSSVPADKLPTGRPSLIRVTLAPGSVVPPGWPFEAFARDPAALPADATARDRLAAWLTAPANERFAQVAVNRVWARLMGRGLVDPVDDWERGTPSHPELLRYLARVFVRSGYDLRHVERLILTSHAYQRAADATRTEPDAYFSAPARRRLTAEQVVDSLFAAAGKPLTVGEVSLDVDGGRDLKNSISLGVPRRAWQFASTSNERDRPSLALPRVQAVIDVLAAFGWRASRPDPTSVRETAPDLLQPAALANGTVAGWLTRLSDDHAVTRLALEAESPEALVDDLFLRVLTRRPTASERAPLVEHLRTGFAGRIVAAPLPPPAGKRTRPRYVSWSNHLVPDANRIKVDLEAAARRGDPPTARLTVAWRERAEDVLWAVLNAPEFVFTP